MRRAGKERHETGNPGNPAQPPAFSFSPPDATLVMTAFLCGLFWGWLFLRYRSLWPGIVSHALWDVLIFVIAPLG